MLLPTMEEVEKKPLYEVGYHLVPTITEDNVGAEVARIREAIESRGGSVVSEEWPKNMSLAYSISPHGRSPRASYDSSYFGWIRFEMQRENIEKFHHVIDALEMVIRFVVIQVPESVLKPRSQRKRPRIILKKETKPTQEVTKEDVSATEEIDREIEKLVAE